jgi:hypothetical protein
MRSGRSTNELIPLFVAISVIFWLYIEEFCSLFGKAGENNAGQSSEGGAQWSAQSCGVDGRLQTQKQNISI